MAKDSSVRRNIIKNVFIIFLVVLLLLTFFSNTILNYSLPEVSAQYPKYGTLSTSIKATGTVKANASYNVIFEEAQAEAEGGVVQSRKVLSVYVKEGDMVAKDSPILQLQGGASQQQAAVQKQYDDLKRTYDLALLDDGINTLTAQQTLADAKKAIADEEERLAELQEEYNALLGGTDNTAVIENRIEYLEGQIEAVDEYIADCQDKIAEAKSMISQAENMIEKDILSTQTVSEKLAEAEAEYKQLAEAYEMLKYDVDYYKGQLEDIKTAQADIGEANTLTNQLRSLEDQLYDLEKQYDRAEEDYREERREYTSAISELQKQVYEVFDELVKLDGELTDEQQTQKEALESQLESLNNQIDSQEKALEKFDKQYSRSEEDLSERIYDLEDDIRNIEDKLDIIGMPEVDDVINYATDYDLAEAQKAYDNAEKQLNEVKSDYEAAKARVESLTKQSAAEGTAGEYEAVLATYEAQLDSLQDQKKSLNKQLTAANKELAGTSAPKDPEDVLEEIETAKNTITKLKTQLEITEATQNKSATSVQLEREDQKKQLEELAAKLESYKTAPSTTDVTAPIAGRIVSINFVPGDTVTSGNTVASIEIADKGYLCEISMDTDEARKIQIGSPCTIANSWWYSNIEASVTQIRSDPQSQGKKRIVTIEVKGDVHEGQSLTFSIGDKSQSYDTVLPNSAIREDNDGKFVLVVDSKNTPLSVRYTARRVNIDVIASDDTQSAVSGLYGSEFVITNSTTPISDKQQVRLAET
ncbi:MAG: HlyD family efflux transporter periplasmic adaptor subunit [Clostridia bacterium]|nr:HlyD family efflux transporter periplasmic adaptor subunit [Clostridia bacterium]